MKRRLIPKALRGTKYELKKSPLEKVHTTRPYYGAAELEARHLAQQKANYPRIISLEESVRNSLQAHNHIQEHVRINSPLYGF